MHFHAQIIAYQLDFKGYRGGKEEASAGVYENTSRKPTTMPTKVPEESELVYSSTDHY
jgi:hypothetical protein